MKNQKSKDISNVIRWILLVPAVCIVDVIVALLTLSLLDYWIDTDIVFLCLAIIITVTSFFLSKFIAPTHKKITGIICALMGFLCSGVFCYVLVLIEAMGH